MTARIDCTALATALWRWPIAICVAVSCALSAAQTGQDPSRQAYRCAPGQYSNTGCPQGRALEATEPPNTQQQQDARAAAARESRLADKLRAERIATERQAAHQRAAGIGPSKAAESPPKAASKPVRKPAKRRHAKASQPVDGEDRKAITPGIAARR